MNDNRRRRFFSETDGAAMIALALAGAVFFVWRIGYARTHGWLILDWAIFRDVLARLADIQTPTTLWESFAAPINHFGLHGHFVLAPLAALLWLPGLAFHLFSLLTGLAYLSLAAALWSLTHFVHTESGSRSRQWIIGLFLLFYLPFWSQAAPGFHPETFAVLGLIGFTVAVLRRHTKRAALAGLLAAISREEMGLVLALLAGAMAFTEKDTRSEIFRAAIPGALFGLFSLVAVRFIFAGGDDGGFANQIIAARYGSFTRIFIDNPLTAFDDRLARLQFLLVVIAPLLPGLLFAGKRGWWLVAALPGLAANLAASYQFQFSDAFYYQVSFLPVLLLVVAVGISRVVRNDRVRLSVGATLLVVAMSVSHSLAYLLDGNVTVPSGKAQAWRVADPQLLADLRELEQSLPPRATIAVGALGLSDYLQCATLPLEGAVKNDLAADFVLLRTDGENYEPRWNVAQDEIAQWLRTHYRPLAQRGNLALLVRTAAAP